MEAPVFVCFAIDRRADFFFDSCVATLEKVHYTYVAHMHMWESMAA